MIIIMNIIPITIATILIIMILLKSNNNICIYAQDLPVLVEVAPSELWLD